MFAQVRLRGRSDLAIGRAGCALGCGFDGLVIIDDPIRDAAEAGDPVLVASLLDWVKNSLLPRCPERAEIAIVGSVFSDVCFMGRLLADPSLLPGFARDVGPNHKAEDWAAARAARMA